MSQDVELFVEYFRQRFGIRDSLWEPYEIQVGKRTVYIRAQGCGFPEGWKIENSGFRVARLTSKLFKPGNRLLQWLGTEIIKGKLEVNSYEFKKLLERKPVVPEKSYRCSRGYVALQFRGKIAGCGFWSGDKLETQMAKGLSAQFPGRALEMGVHKAPSSGSDSQ